MFWLKLSKTCIVVEWATLSSACSSSCKANPVISCMTSADFSHSLIRRALFSSSSSSSLPCRCAHCLCSHDHHHRYYHHYDEIFIHLPVSVLCNEVMIIVTPKLANCHLALSAVSQSANLFPFTSCKINQQLTAIKCFADSKAQVTGDGRLLVWSECSQHKHKERKTGLLPVLVTAANR